MVLSPTSSPFLRRVNLWLSLSLSVLLQRSTQNVCISYLYWWNPLNNYLLSSKQITFKAKHQGWMDHSLQTGFTENLSLVPRNHIRGSKLPVTQAPGDQMISLYCVKVCFHMQKLTHSHSCTHMISFEKIKEKMKIIIHNNLL